MTATDRKEWLRRAAPDLMVLIYNDHVNQFFFDAYPTFALGVGERHGQADEGWGKRDLPDVAGDPDFGWHLARSLVEDEFDPTICQEIALDHGAMGPLPLLWDPPWPAPVVPLSVNVIRIRCRPRDGCGSWAGDPPRGGELPARH